MDTKPRACTRRAAVEAAQASGQNLAGAALFTTLEPCVSIKSEREPCASLIARVGITEVYIGRYDPNPAIHRFGWKALRDAGIKLHDFTADLRSEIDQLNQAFMEHFVAGVGPSGGAQFDYQQNDGRFEVQFATDDERSIMTQWTHRGEGSIYAYSAPPTQVALAKYASTFTEIDDPSALDFNYTVPVSQGEIAVFLSAEGAVLVKVEKVDAGTQGAASQRSLKVTFEVRK